MSDLVRSAWLLTDQAGAAQESAVYTAFGEMVDPNRAAPIGMPGHDPNLALPTRYRYAGGWGYEDGLITLYGANPNLPPVTLQHVGARWFKLGDFDFVAGQGAVVLTNEASPSNRVVMADAVKITKWPSGELFDDDADGDVDASDFGGFSNCLTGPDAGPVDSPCDNQDADGDDDVDLTDFVQFQQSYSGS